MNERHEPMSYKRVKAVVTRTEPTGEVIAMVSPFGGKPDTQGDVIDERAYDQTIGYWNRAEARLPVLVSHDWIDESANLGHVTKLEAVKGYGLVAHIQLDLSNPRAAYVHKLLSERRMAEWSIGYWIPDGGEKTQDDGSTLLTRIHLDEISVVLRGAAADPDTREPRTQLLSIKGTTSSTSTLPVNVTISGNPVDGRSFADAVREGLLRKDEIRNLNRKLDALESPTKDRDPDAAKAVDQLVRETREEIVRESLAESHAEADWNRDQAAARSRPIPDQMAWSEPGPESTDEPVESTEPVFAVREETFRFLLDPVTGQPIVEEGE